MHKTATSWLIYHPKREYRSFDGQPVHFDNTEGNQDPYIWSDQFLHSYCHITQFRAEVGGIHLWVSGDTFPQFCHLFCDLVFVVADKQPWKEPNHITRSDPIVESREAFEDHYRWHGQHPFKRRKYRYTLKADPMRSFQAQTRTGELIDIVPQLKRRGITLDQLRTGLHSGIASRPMKIPHAVAMAVAEGLGNESALLTGPTLRQIRLRHPELASPNTNSHC